MVTQGIDVIGDVHGCHRELTALLRLLGYQKRRGVWKHPARMAVFVGDLIDRGPEILAVLETVAAMKAEGAAECLLGNHERDAVFFHTRLPNGRTLRPRTAVRREQLSETHAPAGCEWPAGEKLDQMDAGITLGVERPGLRVVHAAWEPKGVDFWRGRTLADKSLWETLHDPKSVASVRLFHLVFGPIALFRRAGKVSEARLRWFSHPGEDGIHSLWDSAFHRRKGLLGIPLRKADRKNLWGYGRSEPPLVFGHQSLTRHRTLRPLRSNLACVDYGVAYGGRLCAYRWSGEAKLEAAHFVSVPRFPAPL